jgi:hypothetical protein
MNGQGEAAPGAKSVAELMSEFSGIPRDLGSFAVSHAQEWLPESKLELTGMDMINARTGSGNTVNRNDMLNTRSIGAANYRSSPRYGGSQKR